MKRSILIVGIFMLGLSIGCQKNDDRAPMEIALQNEPPLSFNLVNVPDDATDVDLTPTLSWESAKNPMGTEITYDLYLDTDVNPAKPFESGIGNTSLEIEERLQLLKDYNWKIVAKDNEGKTAQSTIHKFTTRNINFPTEPITAEASFIERRNHTSVVFDDKLWIIGGFANGSGKSDVWYSDDGINWIEKTPAAAFTGRYEHSSLVFDDKMWVIGGQDFVGKKNDVWYSSDGVNWTEATPAAAFTARGSHSSVVFDGKMWVIGGLEGSLKKNDVWYSSDGVNWTEATSSALFIGRLSHSTVVFDGKIWVIGGASGDFGGNPRNDVWYSSDGTNWNAANISAEFPKRHGHSSVVIDDIIWIFGGLGNGGVESDVWYSRNGTKWELAQNNFLERMRHSTTVFKDKIWLIGGLSEGDLKNDVWGLD